jgi:CubicO group peptidase (beta-lactamase class C family)
MFSFYFFLRVQLTTEDYKEFPNREIKKGVAQPWAIASDYNVVPATETLEKTHKELQTVAFLIIKNDSIWHESYFDGYSASSKTNSFSMAKSVVSAALGKAIMDGKIKSLDQKVVDFFPELKGKFAKEVTVGDLSSMA